jgi:hypothetical protein
MYVLCINTLHKGDDDDDDDNNNNNNNNNGNRRIMKTEGQMGTHTPVVPISNKCRQENPLHAVNFDLKPLLSLQNSRVYVDRLLRKLSFSELLQ